MLESESENTLLAKKMTEYINQIIDEKMSNITRIQSAIIDKINTDNTVNLHIPPDSTIYTNIINQSIYQNLNIGDSVKIIKQDNNPSNIWIIGAHGNNIENILDNSNEKFENIDVNIKDIKTYHSGDVLQAGLVTIEKEGLYPILQLGANDRYIYIIVSGHLSAGSTTLYGSLNVNGIIGANIKQIKCEKISFILRGNGYGFLSSNYAEKCKEKGYLDYSFSKDANSNKINTCYTFYNQPVIFDSDLSTIGGITFRIVLPETGTEGLDAYRHWYNKTSGNTFDSATGKFTVTNPSDYITNNTLVELQIFEIILKFG